MITYVIPMISLVITYSLMSRVLWGSKGIGEETDVQRESIRSKQKVARMLIALVILFAICWLPYHAYFLYSYHYPQINQSVIIQHIYLFSYWLAMSNSMYNPLIYYWMNKRYAQSIIIYTFNSFIMQSFICIQLFPSKFHCDVYSSPKLFFRIHLSQNFFSLSLFLPFDITFMLHYFH